MDKIRRKTMSPLKGQVFSADQMTKIVLELLKEYWTHHTNHTKSVYVSHANEVWSSGINYIRINGGFMYLAAVKKMA